MKATERPGLFPLSEKVWRQNEDCVLGAIPKDDERVRVILDAPTSLQPSKIV